MWLLIITTLLWAASFSLIGEYLAGQVDSWLSVLIRVSLAALVFLPFLRWKGIRFKVILLYMSVEPANSALCICLSSMLITI